MDCKVCEFYKDFFGCPFSADCSGTRFRDVTVANGRIDVIEDYLIGWEKAFTSEKMIWLMGLSTEFNPETRTLKLHPIVSEFKLEDGKMVFIGSPYVLNSKNPDVLSGPCPNPGGSCMNCKKSRSCPDANFDLETCENLEPNYITFPIETCVVNNFNRDLKETLVKYAPGTGVQVEYNKQKYTGMFMGEAPQTIALSYGKLLRIRAFMNPCIFVPELNRIIWGSECWWGVSNT